MTAPAFDYTRPPPKWRTEKEHTFYNGEGWEPIPLDENGLHTVEYLRWFGAVIEDSQLTRENHRTIEGKSRYVQRYRVDTYAKGSKQWYGSETRGLPDGRVQAFIPISDLSTA